MKSISERVLQVGEISPSRTVWNTDGKTPKKAFEHILTMHLLFSQQFISHLKLLPWMV